MVMYVMEQLKLNLKQNISKLTHNEFEKMYTIKTHNPKSRSL